MDKPLGARVPTHLIFKYFGGRNMNNALDNLEEEVRALESTIKFLKEEIEGYKIAIQGCNEVFERYKNLKEKLDYYKDIC